MTTLQHLITAAEAIGAEGIWLLNGALPFVEYVTPPTSQDDSAMRALDLSDAGRVVIIRLPGPDDSAADGLITLQPAAGYCRVCGCSQRNACETDSGPCGWVEEDLCSACVGVAA